MYIGEIARLAGTSPKALRHYEALGLLGDVRRSGAYRVYTQQDLAQVKLIRQAQALGFRLAELLPVLAGDDTDWAALSRTSPPSAQVQQDIARLRQLDAQLPRSTGKSTAAWRASACKPRAA
jgi:DNA-binding transcriptional MerR regulator